MNLKELSLSTIALCALAFGGTLANAQSKELTHLTKSEAQKLFPAELVDYKFDSVKVKDKSEAWKEYSATYKTGKKTGKELKVVINDVLPAGDPKWKSDIPSIEKTLGEFASKTVKDEDKVTVMVLVGKRFRIDFKSRQISAEKLEKMAEAFDYKAALAVAGK